MLVTYVRVPTRGQAPYPLVVFGHGFALTPHVYARLLDTWARSGYVVAAPVFPVENPNAPGGPDERDLVNQPGDMSFVVSQLTAPTSPLHGIVDPKRSHSQDNRTEPRPPSPRHTTAATSTGASTRR